MNEPLSARWQVINKQGDSCFTTNDEKIFASYLQFCGIGLWNAQLYETSQLEVKRNQASIILFRTRHADARSQTNNVIRARAANSDESKRSRASFHCTRTDIICRVIRQMRQTRSLVCVCTGTNTQRCKIMLCSSGALREHTRRRRWVIRIGPTHTGNLIMLGSWN